MSTRAHFASICGTIAKCLPPTRTGADREAVVDGLAAGQTQTVNFSVVYPSAGTYQLHVMADGNLAQDEINEHNNTASLAVTVGPSGCGSQGARICRFSALSVWPAWRG